MIYVIIIIISAVITERLLDGLHNFYWTAKLKKYLVGDNDGTGILPSGARREYIRCKFCQSWAMAWVITPTMLLICDVFSWHWVWMGLIVGWLANKMHDIGDMIKAMKYLPFKEL